MAFIKRMQKNILCVTAILASSGAMAADDEYLRMLESEAEGLEVDKSGQLEHTQQTDESSTESLIKTNWKSADALQGGIFPPGLTQDEFVTVLKQNFYGSFAFYQKLNSIDQQTVYYHYTKASPAYLDSIRQDIQELLKNR